MLLMDQYALLLENKYVYISTTGTRGRYWRVLNRKLTLLGRMATSVNNIPRVPIINTSDCTSSCRKINKFETPKARILPKPVLVLFCLAGFHQSQEYLLALVEVEVFACRYLEANNSVEFSEESPLHHYWWPASLSFIKIDLGLILVIV